uniref:NADH dehydrogenase subunit 2 n=1 Tax=Carminodoris armata TaxID=1504998 RepID=UPI00226D29B9|nr:NADH dehydrogenase subunit 2 [Carminodoris armata]UZI00314.1 NADH dehydrogenase subunit 2 [Carminodoris armata]
MSSGNLLFLLVLLTGPLVSVSSTNWVLCWVGMELSFLGAIPLMLMDSGFHSLSKESVMKYFCIQALGSGLLMLGGVLLFMNPMISTISNFIFVLSLFMKLGMFPLHFWVPSVAAGLNWVPMFVLLAWQKIPPFAFLMSMMENAHWMLTPVLVFGGMTALVGAIIGLNQTSLRAMLGSSSIAHTGWACIGAVAGGLWTYFFIYCLSFAVLMLFCLFNNKFMTGVAILSLSGLPPFAMFVGKWAILKSVLMSDSSFLFLILPILSALLSLFFYLKFFYSFYLSYKLSVNDPKYSIMSALLFFGMTGALFIVAF